MNKRGFIKKIEIETGRSEKECIIINEILEENLSIFSKRKKYIVESFSEQLEISNEEAENLYDICLKIIKTSIKNKIFHPFRKEF